MDTQASNDVRFVCESYGTQLHLPLAVPARGIEDGVWRAVLENFRRRRVRRVLDESTEAAEQLVLCLRVIYTSRGTRRPCLYPFEMVEYARKLRGFGFTYKEISEELEHKFKRRVPWITVRDWTQHFYRMAK